LNKLEDYLKHAAECREMARTALPTHRQQLEQMAETCERLAIARKRQLERQGQAETGGQ
jgi:site-specific recombinase XerC